MRGGNERVVRAVPDRDRDGHPRDVESPGLDEGEIVVNQPVDAPPDALAKRLGLAAPALAQTLARLVISGAVRTCPDGRFARR